MAPDWVNRPMWPAPGICGAREAFSRTPGAVLIRPKALGPISRMPYDRA